RRSSTVSRPERPSLPGRAPLLRGRRDVSGKDMKRRLDVLLVERGLAESRSQAQALVLAGLVPGYDKPGQQVEEGAELEVERGPRFVSRGGDKLDNALEAFGLDVAGLDALDLGASAGGFTDVLPQSARGWRARLPRRRLAGEARHSGP